MKYIKIKPLINRVIVNINTLKTYRTPIYINSKYENNWIQVHVSKLEDFIAEQKAQIQNTVVANETTEAKTE